MYTIGRPETSVANCQSTLRNILEDRSGHLISGGSLKSDTIRVTVCVLKTRAGHVCVRACVEGNRTVKSKLVMNNTGKIKLHIIHRGDDNIKEGFFLRNSLLICGLGILNMGATTAEKFGLLD
jgi:hypothetical protein